MIGARQSPQPVVRGRVGPPAPVVVIGAGVGGLACAIALAAAGERVLVLERAASAGGKLREIAVGGHRLDAGPTVFTMRWVFDELFDLAGARFATQVGLKPLPTLARHAWSDTARLDLHADLEHSVDAIARFAGPAEGRRYRTFCDRARAIYDVLEQPFLRSSRPTPVSLVAGAGLRGLPGVLRISPFATLWSALGEHFHDARLRQLFGRYATYCGSSPFHAPATLMLVSHVERTGVWGIDGGMYRLVEAMTSLAKANGALFRFDADVSEIEVGTGAARGVRLADGERIDASAVVFCGDSSALGQGLLGAPLATRIDRLADEPRSLSAVTWSRVATASGFELGRHNVFFGGDSAREFDQLFGRSRLPEDPTVYVCAQDREEPDAPRAAHAARAERLLVLVNAPALPPAGRDVDPTTLDRELERCETRMQARLERCGLTLSGPAPVRTSPADFARLFPGSRGALYGMASHGWMATFKRPAARTRITGLYLAGGTTHPGPGVPMAALSGRQAATSVLADHRRRRPSIFPSNPAATDGGTSTR